jgi:ankyrin repeat protein
VDSPTVEDRLFAATEDGDVATVAALLDEHPDALHARTEPHEHTLLHVAAHHAHPSVVGLLLERGLDVNAREQGDNTYAMHWAAAAGSLEVVRLLADSGGDVVGEGDAHELEVIGWATCWDGTDDAAKRAVADFLVSRGARHHIFSAIALNLADEVRCLAAADPAVPAKRMSKFENERLPLHFAVATNRPEMVALLLELGADPEGTDADGAPASMYASAPGADRPVFELLARRGQIDLFGALVLGDEAKAAELLAAADCVIEPGPLHLFAKRGDAEAARWLLEHGADPNARWSHWDAEVTPLHLAAAQGHIEVVRLLLEAGADPALRDSKHNGDAAGWAEYGRTPQAARWREVIEVIAAR